MTNFDVFPFVIGCEYTPHIATVIFSNLDPQTLLRCRLVSKAYKNYIDSESILWRCDDLDSSTRYGHDLGFNSVTTTSETRQLLFSSLINFSSKWHNAQTMPGKFV